jgi:hypothetical protein
LYRTLSFAWPQRISLYHNLPFLNVIDVSGARIDEVERNFLYKTSLDFTACDRETDRPILSVEFDGLGHGYSRDGGYDGLIPSQRDPYRSEKFNLKLRLARELCYPLFIVSYDEVAPLSNTTRETVTHSIIGRTVAHLQMDDVVQERYAQMKQSLDTLPESVRDEALGDLVTDTDFELSLDWNPLARAEARLSYEAHLTGNVRSEMHEYLCDPPLPQGDPLRNLDVLKARIDAFTQARRLGSRVTVELKTGEPIVREAWVRNISGVWAGGIADDVAAILAWESVIAAA